MLSKIVKLIWKPKNLIAIMTIPKDTFLKVRGKIKLFLWFVLVKKINLLFKTTTRKKYIR